MRVHSILAVILLLGCSEYGFKGPQETPAGAAESREDLTTDSGLDPDPLPDDEPGDDPHEEVGVPVLDVSPTFLDFGVHEGLPDSPIDRVVTVSNLGDADLEILEVAPSADGTLPGFQITQVSDAWIAPETSTTFIVTFVPFGPGLLEGTLVVKSSAPESANQSVELQGFIDAPCIPEEELCDGQDNDCDGLVDEDLNDVCLDCQGNAQAEIQCIDGVWETCSYTEGSDVSEVHLPATLSECEWGRDDNLYEQGAHIQARREQGVLLDLPAERVICDLDLESRASSMRYDDYLIMTLNDVVLMSSIDFTPLLSPSGEFHLYNWSQIVSENHGTFPATTYCAPGAVDCALPATEETGVLGLSFDASGTGRLLDAVGSAWPPVFGLIITGDDNDTDCQHSGLAVMLNYTYEVW